MMGFFSWHKSDDGREIRNKWAGKRATPCKMLDDAGAEYVERDYDGYGIFGGVDYYALLDRMNGGTGDRDRGISLDFSGKPVKRPKLVSLKCKTPWHELPDSKIAARQGYW